MTDREREKQIFDTFVQQKDNAHIKMFVELLELRLAKHKECLLVHEDGAIRGRGLECRELLKNIRGVANGNP